MRTMRVLGLCVALAMGCGGDGGSGPGGCSNVSIGVSAGTTPTFSWNSSACPASELHVNGPGLVTMWSARTVSGGNDLVSSVRYGEMPPTCQGPPAQPLVPGTEYEVQLNQVDVIFGSTVPMGSRRFTP